MEIARCAACDGYGWLDDDEEGDDLEEDEEFEDEEFEDFDLDEEGEEKPRRGRENEEAEGWEE